MSVYIYSKSKFLLNRGSVLTQLLDHASINYILNHATINYILFFKLKTKNNY